jgi:hypothetical protein
LVQPESLVKIFFLFISQKIFLVKSCILHQFSLLSRGPFVGAWPINEVAMAEPKGWEQTKSS